MKKGIVISSLLLITIYLLAQTKPKSTSQTGPDKASMDRGKKVYETYCLACHQADGSGVPRLNPPVIKTKWVLGDKKELITIILKGMDERIEVDGDEYNNVMASHAFLKDEEVADVLTYVRNSFGNKGTAVTPGEVKGVRAGLK
jgi:mono/diheme cytochrome c family protein